MPTVGREFKGQAIEEFPVFVPTAEERPEPKLERGFAATKASFKIDGLDWDALPTLHHVTERLAEIPIYEIIGGRLVEGKGVPDVASAVRIE